jgi:hypothetical protein
MHIGPIYHCIECDTASDQMRIGTSDPWLVVNTIAVDVEDVRDDRERMFELAEQLFALAEDAEAKDFR